MGIIIGSNALSPLPEVPSGLSVAATLAAAAPVGDEALVVIGIGTDLIEIARIEKSLLRFGDAFIDRVYTPGEVAYCRRKQRTSAESFAARFAAKEAGAKALGTGISRGVSWRELEVVRAPGARPELVLHGRAAEIAGRLGIARLSLSLTHSRDVAMAVVVAES